MLKPDLDLSKIKGIAEKFLKRLEKLKIQTVRDLLWHFPFRYDDFSRIVKIADLKINQSATIRGLVKKIAMRRTWRRKMFLVEVLIVDETGGITAIWFNQPYVAQTLKEGRRANFAGKVVSSNGKIYLSNPIYEILNGTTEAKHTAGLIPVYPETKSLTSKGLRYLIKPILSNLEKLTDFLPEEVLKKNNLPEINFALRRIHFPRILEQAEEAKKRFAFEDLFLLQLNNLKTKLRLAKEKAPILKVGEEELKKIVASLPFELTNSQKRSLEEILRDLAGEQPMNRLLQGDVGSGKTAVAAIAAWAAATNGKQTVFMAPTEVLAKQHYNTLTTIFKKTDVSIGLLTGGESRSFYGDNLEHKKSKSQLLKEINEGKVKIIIGTHAVIQKGVMFDDLSLAIVDEQHRFGVEQRAALVKRERKPGEETTIHFLSMSATPIPRTLSLTIFGDLDLSIIDELPIGRKPILTKVISPVNRPKAYKFIRDQIGIGRQAFVICPRIVAFNEEAENRLESAGTITDKRKNLWAEVKNVTEEYEKLSKKIFPDLRVAMLHGRMKSAEKFQVMSDFSSGKIDILVSTSVIEVGVDIPNASIMMIEGADRFGLSQLYQFRGRVGRSEHQSYCFLFTDSTGQSTQERLNALVTAKNGFELAEIDLRIRGPGQFLGEKQTGIPDLAMRALNNLELVKAARQSALEILKKNDDLSDYPLLNNQLKKFEKQIHLE